MLQWELEDGITKKQAAEKLEDLDFAAVVKATEAFVLVGTHVEAVAQLSPGDAFAKIVPPEAKELSAFFRVWCLVEMAAALRFKGYDVRFDEGEGGHSGNHGGSLFPDGLRWLWRDAPGVTLRPAMMPEVQTASWAVDWWMPRHEAKIAERKAMGKVDLLMIGDSITHGWEKAGRGQWEARYAKRNALNLGFGGDRTEHVVWRIQNGAIDDIDPKLAVVMIGTNNLPHDPGAEIGAGIVEVVRVVRRLAPSSTILLHAIPPRGAEPDDPMRERRRIANTLARSHADSDPNVTWLDPWPSLLDENRRPRAGYMAGDAIHFGPKGYQLWATRLREALRHTDSSP